MMPVSSVRGVKGGEFTHVMHGRSRMAIIEPRTLTNAEEIDGARRFSPTRQTLLCTKREAP